MPITVIWGLLIVFEWDFAASSCRRNEKKQNAKTNVEAIAAVLSDDLVWGFIRSLWLHCYEFLMFVCVDNEWQMCWSSKVEELQHLFFLSSMHIKQVHVNFLWLLMEQLCRRERQVCVLLQNHDSFFINNCNYNASSFFCFIN